MCPLCLLQYDSSISQVNIQNWRTHMIKMKLRQHLYNKVKNPRMLIWYLMHLNKKRVIVHLRWFSLSMQSRSTFNIIFILAMAGQQFYPSSNPNLLLQGFYLKFCYKCANHCIFILLGTKLFQLYQKIWHLAPKLLRQFKLLHGWDLETISNSFSIAANFLNIWDTYVFTFDGDEHTRIPIKKPQCQLVLSASYVRQSIHKCRQLSITSMLVTWIFVGINSHRKKQAIDTVFLYTFRYITWLMSIHASVHC